MLPYLVCEFSKPTVSNLVKECFGSDFPDIFRKTQLSYLYQYLKDLDAKSVLLEREYLDKDYLEDYIRYYAKCFQNSGHKCARLHFFSEQVDHGTVTDALTRGPQSTNYEKLHGSYLGFIVVKPLPMTFIGKTCLKLHTKTKEAGTQKVCIGRPYEVDLFGVKLTVQSVAFQEQDKVVSACATTAIWAALHAVGWNHEKQIPSCSEITGNALNHVSGSNNSFPNKGLTNKQILRALDVAGLRYYNESLIHGGYLPVELFDTVRYHVDSRIPLIVGAAIHTISPVNRTVSENSEGHAITILGYSREEGEHVLYVHDDRLGPFAKATFQTIDERRGLVLQRKDDSGNCLQPDELLIPTSLIIATNKKARIPYALPRNTCKLIVQEFQAMLPTFGDSAVSEYKDAVGFSLKLAEVSEVRQELIQHSVEDAAQDFIAEKVKFLTGGYARFQWVSVFTFQKKLAFTLMFDATDIPQGNAISGLYIHDKRHADLILEHLRKAANHPTQVTLRESENFFGALMRFLRAGRLGLAEHLDNRYGELRAPRYVKEDEVSQGNIKVNESKQYFYDATDKSLENLFGNESKLLWAIAEDGAVLIGPERTGQGHPSLTGFKPARIAGELNKSESGQWEVNSKSGRYSSDYPDSSKLLCNALQRIKSYFPMSAANIVIPSAAESKEPKS